MAAVTLKTIEKHVGDPGAHAHLGDQLIWFAIPLLILNVLLVAVDRVGAQRVSHRVVAAIAAVSVLAALGAGVQVYRVGDSGARAAWADRVTSTK